MMAAPLKLWCPGPPSLRSARIRNPYSKLCGSHTIGFAEAALFHPMICPTIIISRDRRTNLDEVQISSRRQPKWVKADVYGCIPWNGSKPGEKNPNLANISGIPKNNKEWSINDCIAHGFSSPTPDLCRIFGKEEIVDANPIDSHVLDALSILKFHCYPPRINVM